MPLPVLSRLLPFILFCCLTGTGTVLAESPAADAPPTQSRSITLNDEIEINAQVYPANGDLLFIWQPHELGLQAIDQQLAASLSKAGIEVWLVDMLESYFLANSASNMDRLNGDGFAALLTEAGKTAKTIVLGASGRGAIPALRGVHQWQTQQAGHSHFGGIVLLSPKLYVETPEPGEAAQFMPIAEATNSSVYILQPKQSPWFWKLNQTLQALQTSGSQVFFKPLVDLRDRFYFRPDAVDHELQASQQLAQEIKTAIRLLSSLPREYRQPGRTGNITPAPREGKQERQLKAYKGKPEPPALTLQQFNGRQLSLDLFKGQVVLVNFWATWCPPCVHEMPSMQRLSDNLSGKPFTILGVNMAESPAAIELFLASRVKVDFPILMDRDGKALKDWGVFAFPTSYVVDKKGRIRYALFGSVEWDDPDITKPILQLVDE